MTTDLPMPSARKRVLTGMLAVERTTGSAGARGSACGLAAAGSVAGGAAVAGAAGGSSAARAELRHSAIATMAETETARIRRGRVALLFILESSVTSVP